MTYDSEVGWAGEGCFYIEIRGGKREIYDDAVVRDVELRIGEDKSGNKEPTFCFIISNSVLVNNKYETR